MTFVSPSPANKYYSRIQINELQDIPRQDAGAQITMQSKYNNSEPFMEPRQRGHWAMIFGKRAQTGNPDRLENNRERGLGLYDFFFRFSFFCLSALPFLFLSFYSFLFITFFFRFYFTFFLFVSPHFLLLFPFSFAFLQSLSPRVSVFSLFACPLYFPSFPMPSLHFWSLLPFPFTSIPTLNQLPSFTYIFIFLFLSSLPLYHHSFLFLNTFLHFPLFPLLSTLFPPRTPPYVPSLPPFPFLLFPFSVFLPCTSSSSSLPFTLRRPIAVLTQLKYRQRFLPWMENVETRKRLRRMPPPAPLPPPTPFPQPIFLQGPDWRWCIVVNDRFPITCGMKGLWWRWWRRWWWADG